jgi:hypothetical protein
VVWEYVFRDSVRDQEYDRLKFVTDDKEIKPGKEAKLTKRIEFAETPSYIKAQVFILRLDFTDDTSWTSN